MRFLRLLFSLTIALPMAGTAYSQAPDLRAQFDAAFQDTLRQPNDPPILVRFAELAVRIGDLESAISALERLLLIEGDQPKVKLELGVLYYRLGSYEAARSYLEAARVSPRATPEVKERSGQFISQIDAKSGKSRFTGDLFTAMRYSTNANSGPTGTINSFGATSIPDPTVSSRSDFSVLGAATLRHRYDLGRQDNGALESDFSFYTARQFQVSEANVLLVDFVTGPKTEPFDGWLDDMTIKPFFMGRYVSVHDLPTYWAWGTGLEAAGPLNEQVRAAFTLFGRRRDFINNTDAPTNDRSSGNEITGVLEFRVDLTSYMTMSLNSNYTRYIAQTDSESYVDYGFGGALNVRFADPLGINGRLWSATASGSVQLADYDQPDLSVDPLRRRSQYDVNLGLVLAIPLDAQVTLVAQSAYVRRTAPINNYAYDAFTALVGVGWRF
jgi:tetratricopeptide (TPR) repeat protein